MRPFRGLKDYTVHGVTAALLSDDSKTHLGFRHSIISSRPRRARFRLVEEPCCTSDSAVFIIHLCLRRHIVHSFWRQKVHYCRTTISSEQKRRNTGGFSCIPRNFDRNVWIHTNAGIHIIFIYICIILSAKTKRARQSRLVRYFETTIVERPRYVSYIFV